MLVHVKKYQYNKGNYEEIRRELSLVSGDVWSADIGTPAAWSIFVEKILKLIEQNIPVNKIVSGRGVHSVDSNAKKAVREKRSKWIKYKYCSTHSNFLKHKLARNNVVFHLRRCKTNFEKKIALNIKNNNKEFWKYVRSNTKTTVTVGKLVVYLVIF